MRPWNHLPLFRLLLPFMAGIICSTFMGWTVPFLLLISLFFLLLYFRFVRNFTFRYRYRWVFGVTSNFLLFLMGLLLAYSFQYVHRIDYFEKALAQENILLVELLEEPVEKANSWKAEVQILQIDGKPTNGKLLLYFQKDTTHLFYGEQLLIATRVQAVQSPQNPNEFNYQRYLSFHRIRHQAYVRAGEWKRVGMGGLFLKKQAINYRQQLLQTLENHQIKGAELSIASALLLGFKADLDQETIHAFASSGAMHVLAVSGLHVGIIYLIFHSMLLFLERYRWTKIVKAILLILLLWGYALLTGLSPSVMRAATMFSFVIVGKAIDRQTNIYNTLAASAFFLMLLNPFILFEVGFQLSYLAVVGIVFLQQQLYVLLTFKWWVLDKIWAISCVSFAAQLATFPLGLLYFHQFPNYFLLSNLAVIPLATLILQLGVGLFLFQSVPFVAEPLAVLLKGGLSALLQFVQWVQQLPHALSAGIDINILETWIIYLAIIALSMAFWKRTGKPVLLGLTLLFLFVSFDVREDYEQGQQTELVVYKVNKHTAIAFIQGREAVVLMDSVLLKDESKQRFHLMHHWWNRGLQQIDKRPLTDSICTDFLFKEGSHLQFGKKRILLLDATYKPKQMPFSIAVDYVLLTASFKGKLPAILEVYKPQLIILDTSLNYYQTKDRKAECEGLGLEFYEVGEGAWVR